MGEHPSRQGVEEGLSQLEIISTQDGQRIGLLHGGPEIEIVDPLVELVFQRLEGFGDELGVQPQPLHRVPANALPLTALESLPRMPRDGTKSCLVVVKAAMDDVRAPDRLARVGHDRILTTLRPAGATLRGRAKSFYSASRAQRKPAKIWRRMG